LIAVWIHGWRRTRVGSHYRYLLKLGSSNHNAVAILHLSAKFDPLISAFVD